MQTLTKTLNGAQILLETLKNLGADTIFGYPGGIVLGVYDELYKQNNIKHYLVRHEQTAVHAAEGYARVTGKCGVALVTSGPGATNIVTGVANAYLDGFPLIVITGQVSAELLHKDAFQEVDIIDITKSCTKKNFQVKKAEDLEQTLVEAFNIAMDGKKGPVVVDITKNVFSEQADLKNYCLPEIPDIKIDDNKIKEVLNTIIASKRPVITAGGGTLDAAEELKIFAKNLNIPVVTTMMGLGNYPADDGNYAGMIGIFGQVSANQTLRESDLIFAIGTRFNDRITCCFKNDELSKKLIHIDIDEKEISKIIPAVIGVKGDAKTILSQMNKLNCPKPDFSQWTEYVKKLKETNVKPLKRTNTMHSFEVIEEIYNCIKDKNPVITTEVGQHQVWAARYLKFNSPRKFLTSGGLGTMGFGFPAAIGACIANRGPVICIAGDGSIQMNIQELATCVDYKLPVKIFILNNGYLGMVRQFQEKTCDERYSETKISSPDFVKLAESYGAQGLRVESLENIKSAIDTAFEFDGPFIIDFVVEPKELL